MDALILIIIGYEAATFVFFLKKRKPSGKQHQITESSQNSKKGGEKNRQVQNEMMINTIWRRKEVIYHSTSTHEEQRLYIPYTHTKGV